MKSRFARSCTASSVLSSLFCAGRRAKVSTEPQRGPAPAASRRERAQINRGLRSLGHAISNERTISLRRNGSLTTFTSFEEQLREIREDLPKSYYYELPS